MGYIAPSGSALSFSSAGTYNAPPGDALIFGDKGELWGLAALRLTSTADLTGYLLSLPGASSVLTTQISAGLTSQPPPLGISTQPLTFTASANLSDQPFSRTLRLALSAAAELTNRPNVSPILGQGQLTLLASANNITGQWPIGTAQAQLSTSTSASLIFAEWAAVSRLRFSLPGAMSSTNQLSTSAQPLQFAAAAALAPSWYIQQPIVSGVRGPWGTQQHHHKTLTLAHTQPEEKHNTLTPGWDSPQKIGTTASLSWDKTSPTESADQIPWGDLEQHPGAATETNWNTPPRREEDKVLPWEGFADELSHATQIDYAHPSKKEIFDRISWGDLDNIALNAELPYSAPPPKDIDKIIFSGPYWHPRWCVRNYPPPVGNKLVFRLLPGYTPPGGLELDFKFDNSEYPQECFDGTWSGPKDAYWYNPDTTHAQANIHRTYIIMNTVSLIRVIDSVPIPIEGLTISTDRDSWCWKLSAQLVRKTELDLVRPSGGMPVEVEANINGITWRFYIEEYGEQAKFGQRSYSISGRSLSAALAAPYSAASDRLETNQRTAQQLAETELVDSGWSLVWTLPEWLVPAGVYTYQQQTPMQSLIAIAAAAGGVIQTAPGQQTLHAVPWYPSLPWQWGAQMIDAIIPEAMIDSQSATYQPHPQYTGVYVTGQGQGVTCFVKRTGTSGSTLAPQQTNPLITDTAAGLALGKKILSDSGPREIITLRIPLLADPGLLTPGELVDIHAASGNWRGLIIGTAISTGRPAVWQTLTLLRYYGT